jgi:EmrB/QacA subfamily drug resistance transporter
LKARILAPENRKWWTLAAVAFGLFMIMLDNTVVNVALPSIERDLHVSISSLEWIVTAYALTFAALLITGGKLGDLFGRKRIFIIGIAIFTLSSLACGLAPSAGFLIGARAVQGVGAALMNPASLSIITATFAPRERGQAIGIWAGVSAMALAIGPLVGGLIVDNINWNWIFYINVPVGIVGIVVSWLVIKESRDTSREQSIDLPGLVTSSLGLFALSYALIEGNSHGWSSPEILGLFAAAAVLLVTFVLLEHYQRLPMLDLSLFKNRSFTGANIVAMLVSLGMFGVFFYVSLYIQNILGFTPTQAGAAFLPMTILIILVAPIAGKWSDRIGSRWLMGAGMTLLGISLLLYQRVGLESTFWTLLPSMLLGGIGMALTMSPMTAAAMRAVPVDKAGVGSGVLNSFRQLGGAIGIALMGAIVASYVTASPGSPASAQQFVDGLHAALLVAAGLTFAAAAVAVLLVQSAKQQHQSADATEAADAAALAEVAA